jgi:hypothetical protein
MFSIAGSGCAAARFVESRGPVLLKLMGARGEVRACSGEACRESRFVLGSFTAHPGAVEDAAATASLACWVAQASASSKSPIS